MPEANGDANAGAGDQSKSGAGDAGTGAQDKSGAATGAGGDPNGAAAGASGDKTASDAAAGGDKGGAASDQGKAADGSDKGAAAGADGGKEKTVTPDWPADWRQKAAGADDKDGKILKQLERFASPLDLVKKLQEQDKLISTFKSPLPKDATPEQLAEYRKANGIPEAADKYDLTLPGGLVVGEKDKPIVNNMLAAMHKDNLTNDQVKNILASYYAQEADFIKAREKAQSDFHNTNVDELNKEWGGEYRNEVTRVENLLNTFSAESQSALQFGVDANGMRFLDNKFVMRDLAVMSRMINPVTTVVGGGGGSQADSVDTEIAQLDALMGDRESKYWKGSESEKLQARYRDLVGWKENQKKRA